MIVPSKFYGIAAAGRPIVMIGDKQGEIGRLVRQHRCGVAIAPGDAVTLADTLRRWSEEPQTVAEMGARARQMLEEKFTKAQAMTRWNQLVDQPADISNWIESCSGRTETFSR